MVSSLQRYLFGGQWLVALAIFMSSSVAFGQLEVAPQSELTPDASFEAEGLPDPTTVPGKEYSNDVDKNAAGGLDPGQVVHWDGDGTVPNTNIWDSFDYCCEVGGGGGPSDFQVDALANIRDKLFLDLDGTRDEVQDPVSGEWGRDTVSLVVSFQDDKNIYASRSAFRDGSTELWAAWDTNINATPGALDDVDGLELYGPDQTDDADMYSREGDPVDWGATERISVFRFKPAELNPKTETCGVSVPYLATSVLIDAVIKDDGDKPNWDGEHSTEDFDVDAMMIWDIGETVEDNDEFGAGDMIRFSVRPIDGLFDGGEIWLYEFGEDKATFLTHGELTEGGGARVWNTAHVVAEHFGLPGENINALEALVPEPSTLALIFVGGLMGGAFMLLRRLRRRCTQ